MRCILRESLVMIVFISAAMLVLQLLGWSWYVFDGTTCFPELMSWYGQVFLQVCLAAATGSYHSMVFQPWLQVPQCLFCSFLGCSWYVFDRTICFPGGMFWYGQVLCRFASQQRTAHTSVWHFRHERQSYHVWFSANAAMLFCSCWAGTGMFLMARHVFLVACFSMAKFCAGLLVSSDRIIPECGVWNVSQWCRVWFSASAAMPFCSCWAGAGMFLMALHVFLVVCLGMVKFCAGLLVRSERAIPQCGMF